MDFGRIFHRPCEFKVFHDVCEGASSLCHSCLLCGEGEVVRVGVFKVLVMVAGHWGTPREVSFPHRSL